LSNLAEDVPNSLSLELSKQAMSLMDSSTFGAPIFPRILELQQATVPDAKGHGPQRNSKGGLHT